MPDCADLDPQRVRQILVNLVGNAIKFTGKGAVTIRLDAPDDATLHFDVTDSGVGIPKEARARIFDEFR